MIIRDPITGVYTNVPDTQAGNQMAGVDPLIASLFAAFKQQDQSGNEGYVDSEGVYHGPIGGFYPTGTRQPTVPETPLEQSLSRGAEARQAMLFPEDLQLNYLQNQAAGSGYTDKEAFQLAQEIGLKREQFSQKNNYADTLAAIAGGKRTSEAEERQRKVSELEQKIDQQVADRQSKEAIAGAKLDLEKAKLNQQWSQTALSQIGAFARTKVFDATTGSERFATEQEMQQYKARLLTLPGALEPKKQIADVASIDQALSRLPQNQFVSTFRRLVKERGPEEALRLLNESTSVPQDLKDLANKYLVGPTNVGQ